MLAFQKYQLEFTAHLRNPKANKKPAKVNDARIAIYREIVFNNLFSAVSTCFPVCQSVLGKRRWRALVRDFFANHQATTPLFREIPQQFLDFLNISGHLPEYDLPIFLAALAHYEWVELAVSRLEQTLENLSQQTDLLAKTPVLAPHMLLAYDYPVHQISAKFKPKSPQAAYLLVFRNLNFEVKFIELNPITYQLLNIIKEHNLTGEQALSQLAEAMQNPDVNTVIGFGAEILNDLAEQGAIIGSANKKGL